MIAGMIQHGYTPLRPAPARSTQHVHVRLTPNNDKYVYARIARANSRAASERATRRASDSEHLC